MLIQFGPLKTNHSPWNGLFSRVCRRQGRETSAITAKLCRQYSIYLLVPQVQRCFIAEPFAGQGVDVVTDTQDVPVCQVLKAAAFWDEAPDDSVEVLICSSLEAAVRMSVVYIGSAVLFHGHAVGKLRAVVEGNCLE